MEDAKRPTARIALSFRQAFPLTDPFPANVGRVAPELSIIDGPLLGLTAAGPLKRCELGVSASWLKPTGHVFVNTYSALF